MKKQTTRILAIIGAVLLILLYVSSLVLSLINHPFATNLLKVAFVGTIVIPIMLYVYLLVYRVFTKDKNQNN